MVAARDEISPSRIALELHAETVSVRKRVHGVREIRSVVGESNSDATPRRVRERVAADAVLRIVDSCDRRMTDPAVRNQGLEPAPEPDAKPVRLVVVVH